MQKNAVTKQDYLYIFFSEDTAKIKDKLLTISSWLFTLLGGVLGFLAKGLETVDLAFSEPKLGMVVSFVGLVLNTYTYWRITEYGEHIRTAWNRTDFLRSKIGGFEEVWKAGYKEGPKNNSKTYFQKLSEKTMFNLVLFRSKEKKEILPQFTIRLLALCVLFGVAFLSLFLIGIIEK